LSLGLYACLFSAAASHRTFERFYNSVISQIKPAVPSSHLYVAALLCFCAGGLYGWSALVPVIETVFHGSTVQAGQVFSLAIVAFTLAVLVMPRLSDSINGLFATGIIGILGAIFLLLAAFSNHYGQFLFCFSAGFGFASGALYINVLSMAAATRHSTWLTPVMVALFGFGGVVFGPLWRQLVARDWGAQALLPLAGLLLLSAIISVFIAKHPLPVGLNFKAKANLSDKPEPHEASDWSVLFFIWGIFFTGSAAGLMVLGLASKIIEQAGGTVAMASAGLAGIAVGNTLGRLSVGVQLFFIGARPVALLAACVVGSGLGFVLFSTDAARVTFGLSLVALGYGIMASAIPAMVQRQFGAVKFSNYFSIVFTAWGVAGLTAPWLAGYLFDTSGSFTSAIRLALLATGFCAVLVISFALIKKGQQVGVD